MRIQKMIRKRAECGPKFHYDSTEGAFKVEKNKRRNKRSFEGLFIIIYPGIDKNILFRATFYMITHLLSVRY
ncbi:hypothetical protein F7731_26145 [Cytobacillus depressus]|uniref:Uncharacterized protein n=1 Tax=Cytobacillus depressus TaxID=1602942 RepID=A0A6L3V1W6_9BACI|nr:hypothetical protein [Cytobacillus depressus]KAB2328002.1 hypothetical protein F7731_26145 [Cytobacillus depressus]